MKMVLLPKRLPKRLFIFLNVVLKVPLKTLEILQRIINTFVWGNKKPRIRAGILERTIQEGGLAIPKFP